MCSVIGTLATLCANYQFNGVYEWVYTPPTCTCKHHIMRVVASLHRDLMFTAGEVEFITIAVDGKYVDWNIIFLQFLVEATSMRTCLHEVCVCARVRVLYVYCTCMCVCVCVCTCVCECVLYVCVCVYIKLMLCDVECMHGTCADAHLACVVNVYIMFGILVQYYYGNTFTYH